MNGDEIDTLKETKTVTKTIQTETPDARGYFGYTIMDADSGEPFATTDYLGEGGFDRAERRRNELALSYGKEFCLRVAGIDEHGNLHEIEVEG